MTTTLTSSDTRPRTNDGIFQIRPGDNYEAIFQRAEEWSRIKEIGACVMFMPGDFTFLLTNEFYHIGSIIGHGIGITRLNRLAQTLFKSLWKFPNISHAPVIGGFDIHNLVETEEPAIVLGGSQNIQISDVYSWGKPADFLRLENAEPVQPPTGRPFGTWTENVMLRRIVIYGPKRAGITFRNSSPEMKQQSFSNFKSDMVQITLTEPGSKAVDFESHIHAYSSEFRFKINVDGSCNGDAVGVNVGPECNNTGNFWHSFIEGVPLYGPNNEVIRPAGYRIKVAPSARVLGHGKFYRQLESHTPDWITPGVNYRGEQAGRVQAGILEDEGI
jgi:hypothetical protein